LVSLSVLVGISYLNNNYTYVKNNKEKSTYMKYRYISKNLFLLKSLSFNGENEFSLLILSEIPEIIKRSNEKEIN
jgi:hypothetical protein